jgi:hypothetical protein
MRGDYPCELEDCGQRLAPYGVANVTVRAPEGPFQPLPWRSEDGRTLYPWGKFTGTWTIPEIRLAESEGVKILRVNQCWGTAECSRPYADYVARLYDAKLRASNEAERVFFKFLMNCRYGRMGLTGKLSRTVWQTMENRDLGVPFGDKVLLDLSLPLPPETNWSHAAYVASYARIELFRWLKTVGAGSLIYCDTDSVIFDCPTKIIPFPTGTGLGEMRLESWISRCEVFAPKVYQSDARYVAKGIPKRLARKFIEEEKVEFDMPFRYREAIAYYDDKDKRGLARWPNTHRLSVWRKVRRKLFRNYDRKKLSGNRFSPCKVVEKP